MSTSALIEMLLVAGRAGDYAAVALLPGANIHCQVVAFASELRGPYLEEVAALCTADRVAFAKAVAVYESSVGGIGSVTALEPVLSLFANDVYAGREALRWILLHTKSLDYYRHRAVDLIVPDVANLRREAEKAEHERRNYELAAPFRKRRAERATASLFNAARRGDVKAVQAQLQKGASPHVTAPDGTPLVQYAEDNGHVDIANLLRDTATRTSAA